MPLRSEAPSPEPASTVQPAGLPLSKRLAWGAGGFADFIVQKGVNSLINPVYVVALGYSPLVLSVAQAALRVVDSMTDAAVGFWSDNTRSRWGRRRPWMLAGLLITAASVAVFFFPPAVPKAGAGLGLAAALRLQWQGLLFYFLASIGLFAVGYTLFIVPYTGLGYELTTDYDERTHLFKWRYLLFTAAGFLTPWFPRLAIQLEGDRGQTLKGAEGGKVLGVAMAVLVLAAGLLPVLFCRERTASQIHRRKISFLEAVRRTFSSRPFLLVLSADFVTKFAMTSTGVFFFYIFVFYIGGGDLREGTACLGVYFTATNLANVCLGMGSMAWLSGRCGKKAALLTCLAGSVASYGSFWVTATNRSSAFMTVHLWGGHAIVFQWPSLITAVGIGIFTNTMLMLTQSMVADVCDLDELTIGQRRDAFFGAAFSMSDKVATGLSTILQGALLVWSGFDATAAVQSPATMALWLKMLVFSQSLGFVAGFFLICFYPLSRIRCLEIRRRLEAARA